MKYVTAAAMMPIPSIRKPLKKKFRPVNTEMSPPMMKSDTAHTAALAMNARAKRLRATYFGVFEVKEWLKTKTPLGRLVDIGSMEIDDTQDSRGGS